ncbi:MAG: response regulator [Magnetovibrio sp.]|nr:response regulator [Magnetovibrio sp.]
MPQLKDAIPREIIEAAKLLIVDDNPVNVMLLEDVLEDDGFDNVVSVTDSRKVKALVETTRFDLIFLDINMPHIDGFGILEQLGEMKGADYVPVLVLTAQKDQETRIKALEMGAMDFITKPFDVVEVLNRVNNTLAVRMLYTKSEELVARRTQELSDTQDVMILGLTTLAETRDNETGDHIRRTQRYVEALAQKLQEHPNFKDVLDDHIITLLYKSAPLHDIGKVGIPDSILRKLGKLTEEEYAIMQTHPTLGMDAILTAEHALHKDDSPETKTTFLTLAREIAYCHHEKWDGSGYPQQLSKTDIPLSARLMAVADVYDALISKRIYKDPFTHEDAVSFIKDGRGTHFDPDVIDAFVDIADQFSEIAKTFDN